MLKCIKKYEKKNLFYGRRNIILFKIHAFVLRIKHSNRFFYVLIHVLHYKSEARKISVSRQKTMYHVDMIFFFHSKRFS